MYVVRVVGPSGTVTYLNRGRRVSSEAARWYSHPSECRAAISGFQKKHPGFFCDFFDPRDPERHVDQ